MVLANKVSTTYDTTTIQTTGNLSKRGLKLNRQGFSLSLDEIKSQILQFQAYYWHGKARKNVYGTSSLPQNRL